MSLRLNTSLAIVSCVFAIGSASAQDVTGAGATFPAPIYAKWADAYNKATGARINYQSVGSGAGIRQIKGKTVDFGASDMPLTDDELAKDGMIQFPTVIGGVVPVVNIKGIAPGQIKLTGQVLGDIYLGKITKWNDAALTALNPGVPLPDAAIARGAPRRRFRHQLHLHQLPLEGQRRVEDQGRRRYGRELAGGCRRQGQRGRLRLRAAPAELDRLCRVRLRQAEQDDVRDEEQGRPLRDAERQCLQGCRGRCRLDKIFYQMLTEQPGKDSWPITNPTFILMHKVQDKPANATNSLKFFDWAYVNGDKMADDLDYVPLPGSSRTWCASSGPTPQGRLRQGDRLQVIEFGGPHGACR
jgi:phosphate transport system substrate-binding protein